MKRERITGHRRKERRRFLHKILFARLSLLLEVGVAAAAAQDVIKMICLPGFAKRTGGRRGGGGDDNNDENRV